MNWVIYLAYLAYHVIATFLEWVARKTRTNGYVDITFHYRRVSREQVAKSLKPGKRRK